MAEFMKTNNSLMKLPKPEHMNRLYFHFSAFPYAIFVLLTRMY